MGVVARSNCATAVPTTGSGRGRHGRGVAAAAGGLRRLGSQGWATATTSCESCCTAANSYGSWAKSLHPPLDGAHQTRSQAVTTRRRQPSVSGDRRLRGWRPEGPEREETPDEAGKRTPGKAWCVMPSELVDSAVTASFSAGDSVVMDGCAAGPASLASCLPRRGCVTLSRTVSLRTASLWTSAWLIPSRWTSARRGAARRVVARGTVARHGSPTGGNVAGGSDAVALIWNNSC